MTDEVRVRFAPSPTGPFHIGGARSALFNWFLARQSGGKLILRIEDTDRERSSRESEENIKAALKWLGMDWDEGIDVGGDFGPYRQTERLSIYKEYTDQLLANGQAYYCYCTDEELEAERQALLANSKMPRYMGKCRHLTSEDQARLKAEGRKPTIRFRVPENQEIIVDDMVRGHVSFDSNGIGDFVIVKSDGMPTYNYAVVIDDALMHITHVIRAEEHLSNTPRQLLIYEALNFQKPRFGHISLILGKDRTKMSKRHGATSVEQYKNLGYLPEALVNFLALLGWSPQGEEELLSIETLVSQFSIDRVAKNPAVFDIDKLNWINSHYMRQLSIKQLTEMCLPHLKAAGYISETEMTTAQYEWLEQVVAAVQDYLSYAAQITDHVGIFFNDDFEFATEEAQEAIQDESVPIVIETFKQRLAELDTIDAESVKSMLKKLVKELKLGGKKVYMPLRIAMTGQTHGPELYHIIPILGRDRIVKRIDQSLAKI